MADFLEVKILDKELEELKEHLTFKNMKKNASVNYSDLTNYAKKVTKYVDDNLVFMRNGESGGWVNVYSQEMIGKFK